MSIFLLTSANTNYYRNGRAIILLYDLSVALPILLSLLCPPHVHVLHQVEVASVKTRVLPPWDEALAERIRPGMTLEQLEEEVREMTRNGVGENVLGCRDPAMSLSLS